MTYEQTARRARRPLDFYQTPASAVHELLQRVQITGLVYEPCAGDGAIVRALEGPERCVESARHVHLSNTLYRCSIGAGF